jgi:dTMP kinase
MPLITFEGIDGSGKGTQIRLLRKHLVRAGIEPVLFREPGGTRLSERVRSVLLDPDLHIEPLAELFLFSAARSQLCAEEIRPLLDRGKVVMLDRFFDSTVAYQGGGREIGDFEWLTEFNRRVTGDLTPDRTYYLRVSTDEAFRRRRHRTDDRLEAGGAEFFERVAASYERIAREHPDRVLVIDGDGTPDEIAEVIWADARAIVGVAEPGS